MNEELNNLVTALRDELTQYGEVLAGLGDSIGAAAAEEKVTQLTTT